MDTVVMLAASWIVGWLVSILQGISYHKIFYQNLETYVATDL